MLIHDDGGSPICNLYQGNIFPPYMDELPNDFWHYHELETYLIVAYKIRDIKIVDFYPPQ